MKITLCKTTTLAILAMCSLGIAQTLPSGAAAESANRGPTSTTAPATEDYYNERVFPEVNFDQTPLDAALKWFSDQEPRFTPSVIRDPELPAGTPLITLRARNVTIGQFLEYLGVAYGIGGPSVGRGASADIWVIKVPANMYTSARLTQPQLTAYSLREALIPLVASKEGPLADREKQAMNDVLTLIQTALDRGGPKTHTLKVHEATRTLLLTGVPADQEIVEHILRTLRPYTDDIRAKYEDEKRQLQQQIDQLKSEIKVRDQTIQDYSRALTDAARSSTTRPRE